MIHLIFGVTLPTLVIQAKTNFYWPSLKVIPRLDRGIQSKIEMHTSPLENGSRVTMTWLAP